MTEPANAYANLIPLGERLLVREIERTKTGAIYQAQVEGGDEGPGTQYCEIVAAPEGCVIVRKPLVGRLAGATTYFPLLVGARIYIARYKSARITVNGEDLYVVEAEDALVVERAVADSQPTTHYGAKESADYKALTVGPYVDPDPAHFKEPSA